ncbi:MAG: hypothetical protein Q8858_12275 [Bacteroidota bacterium]|nr:hypothetical protein [Bacteroidota bacterium]MDP4196899.1 hypothetical protein [Bacteroidota bacterium]
MSSNIKNTINLNFKVPAEVVYKLKIIAFQNHMKEKDFFNKILKDFVDKNVQQINPVSRV